MNRWTKTIGLAIAGLSIMAFGLTRAEAATTDDVYVTVTVDIISVAVGTTTWAIGQVAPSDIAISSAIPVTNDGNQQEDYSLILAHAGDWGVSANASPGVDEFVLSAIFTDKGIGTMVDADFVLNDTVEELSDDADAGIFAIDADGDGVKGFNVLKTEERQLHLNFRAPSSNTAALEQTISVTVTAAAG